MTNDRGSIIKSGLRSIAALIPGASPLVQAWTEYESYQQNRRIEQFFDALRSEIQADAAQLHAQLDAAVTVSQFPELLERAATYASRTSSSKKHRAYARAIKGIITSGDPAKDDACFSILDTIDILTESDVAVLGCFAAGDVVVVEDLRRNRERLSSPARSNIEIALPKLQSRGLIVDTTPLPQPRDFRNDSRRWGNMCFQITMFGHEVVELLNDTREDK